MPEKIAIIGPESSGKSTLTQQLAAHFNEPFVPEYGRLYLEQNGPAYSFDDLKIIADKMLTIEAEKREAAHRFLFCDTDLIMIKVWYQVKYNTVPKKLIDQIAANPYSFYFICYPDLPWEADPLRENPNRRRELFDRYLKEVTKLGTQYKIIKGENRLPKAVSYLSAHFI